MGARTLRSCAVSAKRPTRTVGSCLFRHESSMSIGCATGQSESCPLTETPVIRISRTTSTSVCQAKSTLPSSLRRIAATDQPIRLVPSKRFVTYHLNATGYRRLVFWHAETTYRSEADSVTPDRASERVRSLGRAFELLEAIAEASGIAGLSQLAAHPTCPYQPSTAFFERWRTSATYAKNRPRSTPPDRA